MSRTEADDFEDDGISHKERMSLVAAKIAKIEKRQRIAFAVRGWAALLTFGYFVLLVLAIIFANDLAVPLFLAWPVTLIGAAVMAFVTIIWGPAPVHSPDTMTTRHVGRRFSRWS